MKTLQKFKKPFTIFTLLIYIFTLHGCQSFITKRTLDVTGKEPSEMLKTKNTNYYILHIGDNVWEMNDVNFAESNISGVLTEMDENAKRYFQRYEEEKNEGKVWINRSGTGYAYQIHIYVSEFEMKGERIHLVNEKIQKINVYKPRNNSIGKFLLITGGIAGGIGIFLAVACGCPHVYLTDNGYYYFNNTLFTGATAKVLERHDYKMMPDFSSGSDKYEFFVKNEEKEQQFTNLMELMVVEHEKDVKMIPDQDGKVYSISKEIFPTKMTNEGGENLMPLAGYEDDRGYVFNDEAAVDYTDVFATFEKPSNVDDAKLVLKIKNTEWAALVYNEFTTKLGRYHDNWVKSNAKKTRMEMKATMKDAGIPLVVSIKNGNEWIDIDAIDLIGDANYNSLVVPIKKENLNADKIEIRIRSGFMFWKMDYLAMDFSAPTNFNVEYLKPSVANGNEDKSFIQELALDDDSYMEQLETGDSTFIQFTGLKTASDKSRTIILHSKGYYLSQKEFTGKPDFKELKKFKEIGGLSRYSKELYTKYFEGLTVNFE